MIYIREENISRKDLGKLEDTLKREIHQISQSIRDEIQRAVASDPDYRRWRPYTSYRDSELRAVKFPSRSEVNRAVDLIYEDSDLKGLPRYSFDGMTFFVPTEAVHLLRTKGLNFEVYPMSKYRRR